MLLIGGDIETKPGPKKNTKICCKIFKACLTILGHYALTG